MKAAFVALCLASVALAQSTSGIPSGTSAACNAFLTEHNNNQVINTCLTSIISSTSAFDDTSSGSINATAVNAALSTLCSSSFDKCPPAAIRSALTNFYAACSTDLLGASGNGSDGNDGVIAIYDNLYLILPLKDAICAKADGKYCISNASSGPSTTPTSQAASSSSSSSASAASASASAPAKRHAPLHPSQLSKRVNHDSHLVARQATNGTEQTTLAPNPDSYRESGLPYLFIQPNSTTLCSACTAQVIGAYIRFETVTPYAIGIANSPILSGQLALWEQIKQCPDNFAQGLLNNYTTTGDNNNLIGGAAKAAAGVGSALVAVFAAVGAAMLL